MLRQFKFAEDILLGNTNTISECYQEQVLFILRGKPFWIWDKEEHRQQGAATNGQCCWNHAVGLPTKDKKEFPLFDYENFICTMLLLSDGDVRGGQKGGGSSPKHSN